MKINFILPVVEKSGGVMVALNYAKILKEKGHDVLCYYPISGAYTGVKKVFFFKLILRWIKNDEYRGNWYEAKRILKHPMFINSLTVRNADITIATSWVTSYWVNALSKNKGKKIYFIQGYETWGNNNINKKVKASYKFNFDKRIVVSTELHDKLKEECGVESSIVCNGLEKVFIDSVNKQKSIDDYITIGFPYRESHGLDIKNCKMGLDVLNSLYNKRRIKIKAFGFKKPNDWNNKFDFLENPSRAELIKFYNSIDVFYVPSIHEGWGLPAMEAMAFKCCVISGNFGVIKEIGINKINCMVLKNPEDEKEALNLLDNLVLDKKLIDSIGQQAYLSVKNYTIENSVDKFEKVLLDTVC